MSSDRRLFEQLKDEFTLWLLLYKLDQLHFRTGKLKLQKLLYLIDVFGSLNDEKPTSYTFRVYKHGPYTKEIQCDVEHLAAKGLVKIKETTQWNPSHDRSFQYRIETPNITRAQQIFEILDFADFEKTIDFVIQAAGYLSSRNIQNLVYSEPNFIEAKRLVDQKVNRFACPIDPRYDFLNRFREIADELINFEYGYSPSKELVFSLYLNFIRTIERETHLGAVGT